MGWELGAAELILCPPAPYHEGGSVAALANSASPAQGPYRHYLLLWAPQSSRQWLRQLCDKAGPIPGITAAGWGAPLWALPWAGCTHQTSRSQARRPLGWGVQGGRAPQPPASGGGSPAWLWMKSKGSGMGNEVLPFWWQCCGIILAQKDGWMCLLQSQDALPIHQLPKQPLTV